jgi:hypothetical protein
MALIILMVSCATKLLPEYQDMIGAYQATSKSDVITVDGKEIAYRQYYLEIREKFVILEFYDFQSDICIGRNFISWNYSFNPDLTFISNYYTWKLTLNSWNSKELSVTLLPYNEDAVPLIFTRIPRLPDLKVMKGVVLE